MDLPDWRPIKFWWSSKFWSTYHKHMSNCFSLTRSVDSSVITEVFSDLDILEDVSNKKVMPESKIFFSPLGFVCYTKILAIAIIFISFSFSPQQIWMDWRKLLAKFSTVLKLNECGLIQRLWRTLCEKYSLQFKIFCVSEKIIMAEVSGHTGEHVNVINVFSWCKLNLIHGD